MLNNQNKNKLKCYLSRYNPQNSLFLQIRQYYKRGGGVSVAHIADDIQKESKTFYLLYI